MTDNQVIQFLKNTSKGRLKYDKNWKEEGRTKEIIEQVKLNLSAISISPRSLTSEDLKDESDNQRRESQDSYVYSSNKYKVTHRINDANLVWLNSPDKEFQENHSTLNDSYNVSKESNLTKSNSSGDENQVSKLNKRRSITQLDLLEYEKERIQTAMENAEKQIKAFASYVKENDEQSEEQRKLIKQRYYLEGLKKSQNYTQDYEQLLNELNRKRYTIETNHNLSESSNKLKEIENKHLIVMNQMVRKKREERQKLIIDLRSEIDSNLQEINRLFSVNEDVLRNNSKLNILVKKHEHELFIIIQNIDHLLTKEEISNEEVEKVLEFKKAAANMKSKIELEVEEAKKCKQTQSEISHPKNELDDIELTHVHDTNSKQINSEAVIDPKLKFTELKNFLSSFENSFQNFLKNNKDQRIGLHQCIMTTINTISNDSPADLKLKLDKLVDLFENKSVKHQEKLISCNNNSEALNYCFYDAAKTFISVGTIQVTSNEKSAFRFAAVIVQLWSRFPIFGKIFMAWFVQKCPYIIHYYPNREDFNDDNSYLIACGYTVKSDSKSESEESFLNKMRAMIKIYAAIIQSNAPNNPHDINNGWMWLALILNSPPLPNLTPAILHAFLFISAHKLLSTYQKQFMKLLIFIELTYIPMIEKVQSISENVIKQTLGQLKLYIEKIMKKLKRNPSPNEILPDGVLKDYFWQDTYSHSRSFTSTF